MFGGEAHWARKVNISRWGRFYPSYGPAESESSCSLCLHETNISPLLALYLNKVVWVSYDIYRIRGGYKRECIGLWETQLFSCKYRCKYTLGIAGLKRVLLEFNVNISKWRGEIGKLFSQERRLLLWEVKWGPGFQQEPEHDVKETEVFKLSAKHGLTWALCAPQNITLDTRTLQEEFSIESWSAASTDSGTLKPLKRSVNCFKSDICWGWGWREWGYHAPKPVGNERDVVVFRLGGQTEAKEGISIGTDCHQILPSPWEEWGVLLLPLSSYLHLCAI